MKKGQLKQSSDRFRNINGIRYESNTSNPILFETGKELAKAKGLKYKIIDSELFVQVLVYKSRVYYSGVICNDVHYANRFCSQNEEYGVLCSNDDGTIYLAKKNDTGKLIN